MFLVISNMQVSVNIPGQPVCIPHLVAYCLACVAVCSQI